MCWSPKGGPINSSACGFRILTASQEFTTKSFRLLQLLPYLPSMLIKCLSVFSKAGRDCYKGSFVYFKHFLQLRRVSLDLIFQIFTNSSSDREEALKDDFPLDGSAYDDEDEDDEWAGDDTAWTEEADAEDEGDGKDESSAYLEFLNEEVRPWTNNGSE